MIPTPWQMKLHWLLTTAARDLGYPEGYAPSGPRYREWAKARGYPSDSKLAYRTPGQSWGAVVRRAGLKPASRLWCPAQNRQNPFPPMTRKALQLTIIEDLRRVAREIGRPENIPAPKVYRRHGRFDEREVKRALTGSHLASWHDVAATANLLPNRTRNGYWTAERLENAYRTAAKELGRKPGGPGLTAWEIHRHIADTRTLAPLGAPNELAERFGFQPWPSGFVRNHPTPGKRQGKGCMRRAA